MTDTTYQKFSAALLPIFNGIIEYTKELQLVVLEFVQAETESAMAHAVTSLQKLEPFLPRMMNWYENDYPEWVLKRGFNRHLRSGFRYVLLHLDELMEALLALDFHIKQVTDSELLKDISKQLVDVSENNNKMLSIIIAFFAAQPITQDHENFTSDVTDLYNIARSVLPSDMELIDMNPDYLHLASVMRNAVDQRQILLKILTALPIDELAVKE